MIKRIYCLKIKIVKNTCKDYSNCSASSVETMEMMRVSGEVNPLEFSLAKGTPVEEALG